jgi:hypothetical protein
MKKAIVFGICMCLLVSVSAQNYIAEYRTSLGFVSHLMFNSGEWRYDVKNEVEKMKIESSGGVDLGEDLSEPPVVEEFFFYRSLTRNVYLDNELNFSVIRGELEKPEWIVLSDSIRAIEG